MSSTALVKTKNSFLIISFSLFLKITVQTLINCKEKLGALLKQLYSKEINTMMHQIPEDIFVRNGLNNPLFLERMDGWQDAVQEFIVMYIEFNLELKKVLLKHRIKPDDPGVKELVDSSEQLVETAHVLISMLHDELVSPENTHAIDLANYKFQHPMLYLSKGELKKNLKFELAPLSILWLSSFLLDNIVLNISRDFPDETDLFFKTRILAGHKIALEVSTRTKVDWQDVVDRRPILGDLLDACSGSLQIQEDKVVFILPAAQVLPAITVLDSSAVAVSI